MKTDAKKEQQGAFKAGLLNLLHQHSVARGIAAYRLANETSTPAVRMELEATVEKADWLLGRLMAAVAILMADDCQLRRQFLDDGEFRVVVVEELVEMTENGNGSLGAVVKAAQAAAITN